MSKRNILTIKEKINLLEEFQSGKSRKDIMEQYGIAPSTLCQIIKSRSELEAKKLTWRNLDKKRDRKPQHHLLNNAMTKWYETEKDADISGAMVLEKAKEFAKELNINDFEPNQGWLQRWKRNENIVLKKSSPTTREISSNEADSDSSKVLANFVPSNASDDIASTSEVKEDNFDLEISSPNSVKSLKYELNVGQKKIICRVCLKTAKCALNIFDTNGVQLNISEIILQHFWFKPMPDDPISSVICRDCWVQLNDFHEFYVRVEHAHENFNHVPMTEDNVKEENSDILGALLNVEVSIKKEDSEESDMNPLYEPQVSDILADFMDIDANEDKISSVPAREENQLADTDNVVDLDVNLYGTNNEEEDAAGQDNKKMSEEEESEIENFDEISNIDSSSDGAESSPKVKEKKPRKKLTKKVAKKKPTTTKPVDVKKKNEDRIKWIESKQKDEEMIKKHIAMGCDLCTFVGDTFADMTQHFRDAHPTLRPYVKCCDRKLNRRLVAQHAYKHENPNFFRCEECQRNFSNKYTLNFHMMSNHASEDQLIFSCDKCPRRFPRKYLLDIHTPSHIPMEEREFMCEQCPGKAFASKYLLQIHVSMQHKKAINVCHVCAKSIRHNQDFEKHVRAHFEESGPRLKCPRPDCDHWLKDEENLKRHMRRHDEEGKVFICRQCGKSCKNSRSLVSHIHYSHSKAVFECEVCQKKFKRAITLKEHMAQHTGQTLYKCPFCERTFNSNANMHSHKKKMHPIEWEHWRRTKNCSSQQVLPS